jgi:outer membrane protein assembly factor BamB
VLTPMSYAGERLFVPVVEQCVRERSTGSAELPDLRAARGEVVAIGASTGRKLWVRRLPSAATGCTTVAGDVVFAPTLAGDVFGLAARDGRVLWRSSLSAGINGCPAVSGDLLIVGAGAPRPAGAVPELVAYGVGEGRP